MRTNFSRRHFEIFVLYSPENRLWHVMQRRQFASKPIFWKTLNKICCLLNLPVEWKNINMQTKHKTTLHKTNVSSSCLMGNTSGHVFSSSQSTWPIASNSCHTNIYISQFPTLSPHTATVSSMWLTTHMSHNGRKLILWLFFMCPTRTQINLCIRLV